MSKMASWFVKAAPIKIWIPSTNKPIKFYSSLNFKLEANGNSGVFIRSGIEGTKISGWQVVAAPPNLHTGGIYMNRMDVAG